MINRCNFVDQSVQISVISALSSSATPKEAENGVQGFFQCLPSFQWAYFETQSPLLTMDNVWSCSGAAHNMAS